MLWLEATAFQENCARGIAHDCANASDVIHIVKRLGIVTSDLLGHARLLSDLRSSKAMMYVRASGLVTPLRAADVNRSGLLSSLNDTEHSCEQPAPLDISMRDLEMWLRGPPKKHCSLLKALHEVKVQMLPGVSVAARCHTCTYE